jgi:hypothetical protein
MSENALVCSDIRVRYRSHPLFWILRKEGEIGFDHRSIGMRKENHLAVITELLA